MNQWELREGQLLFPGLWSLEGHRREEETAISLGCKGRHPLFAIGVGWVRDSNTGEEEPEQELWGGRVLAFAEYRGQAMAGDLGLGQMFKNRNIFRKRLGPCPLCIKETSRFLITGLTCATEIFWCAGEVAFCACAASLCSTDSRSSPRAYSFLLQYNNRNFNWHVTAQNKDVISQVFLQLVFLSSVQQGRAKDQVAVLGIFPER